MKEIRMDWATYQTERNEIFDSGFDVGKSYVVNLIIDKESLQRFISKNYSDTNKYNLEISLQKSIKELVEKI
jgi:hypothetical protein